MGKMVLGGKFFRVRGDWGKNPGNETMRCCREMTSLLCGWVKGKKRHGERWMEDRL